MNDHSEKMLDESELAAKVLRRGNAGEKSEPTAEGEIRGTPGKTLLRFAGSISPDEAAEIKRAIEEDCGKLGPSDS